MIISLLNQKGGVGKTTLAVNISRAYTRMGLKTILIDSDPQGSAQKWHERSKGELIDMTCLSMCTLEKDIQKYVDKYERIIIDGIPRISATTVSAIQCSDLILVPVQPSPYDAWATEDIIHNIKSKITISRGATKAFFLISRQIPNTNLAKDIRDELDKMGLPIFKNGTSQRVAYATSVEKGSTVVDEDYRSTEACKEIEKIIQEIEALTNGVH